MTQTAIKTTFFALFLVVFSTTSLPADARILFTANIFGTIQNCHCGSNPLGGVDLLKTFIDSDRRDHPHCILIDGGDYFNSYPFPELNQAMLQTIRLLKYDVMVPGENAFIEPGLYTGDLLQTHRERILISNSGHPGQKYLVFERAGFKIFIWSFVSLDRVYASSLPNERFLTGYISPVEFNTSDNYIYILVFHGELEDLSPILSANPQIDLVLAGHIQEKGIREIEGVKVVCNGRDGEVVAAIDIRRGTTDRSIEITHHNIGLHLATDPAINALINNLKSQVKATGLR